MSAESLFSISACFMASNSNGTGKRLDMYADSSKYLTLAIDFTATCSIVFAVGNVLYYYLIMQIL
jgi:hypothetical protein